MSTLKHLFKHTPELFVRLEKPDGTSMRPKDCKRHAGKKAPGKKKQAANTTWGCVARWQAKSPSSDFNSSVDAAITAVAQALREALDDPPAAVLDIRACKAARALGQN